jgi:hypothetical protein
MANLSGHVLGMLEFIGLAALPLATVSAGSAGQPDAHKAAAHARGCENDSVLPNA